MGIFGKFKGILGKKKKETVENPSEEPLVPPVTREEIPREELSREPLRREVAPTPALTPTPIEHPSRPEKADISNLRTKIDLLLTEMDSIKTQNQMINERLKAIEKTLAEMRGIRYY